MKRFMDENFMLSNETAVELYHNFAKDMPICDYHCHLSPKEIWENKRFRNITDAWLRGDHYKWRVLRSNGIPEEKITGDANDYEKFRAWAKTIPYTIGNPLYHWTHLELQRYFGIYDLLNEETARSIYQKTNELLNGEGFTARDLIEKSNVKMICTTDDPVDTLEYHQKIRGLRDFDVKVLPTFRPDKGVNIQLKGFNEWVEKLIEITGYSVYSLEDYCAALENRAVFFHTEGCRLSDHAFDYIPYSEADIDTINAIFQKARQGKVINLAEENQFKTYMMKFFGKLYSTLGWTMQLHIGTMRNNNARMFDSIGADTGFDSINDYSIAVPLSRLLDSLELEDLLPKTILYTLNPKDNYVLGTMMGNFQGGGIPGKIQFGSGWWFNDQRDGMVAQMKALASLGLLSRFVGMLTDSRSFLSYPRHEYFRRILCNLAGEWVENGEFPKDMNLLKDIIQGICFENAKDYFGFEL